MQSPVTDGRVCCRPSASLLLTATSFVFSSVAFAVTMLGMRTAARAVVRSAVAIGQELRRWSAANLAVLSSRGHRAEGTRVTRAPREEAPVTNVFRAG